ncbi:hypothetical protein GWE18_05500 [Bradyrhizobium sp. CSA112]|uniref:hypothetical protein n=1 Tax=Bradyrhizobium sp. CSA112 TaxID=2699170 RepID=UPI0023AE70D5|nr:hypothetical protein [Bradyrhizobium sp. CSA112]MDE5452334.1 hypothetical protein [Bradyrhizobium sp. CSA112]
MASHTKSQPNSGFNRRLFLAGAAGGAMLPVAAAHAVGSKKKQKRGIYADEAGKAKEDLEDKVADFSYQNDVLAQWIVDIWTGPAANPLITPSTGSISLLQYRNRSTAAKADLAARGIYLEKPIVITEDEYDAGFSLEDAGLDATIGVVFVLPRPTRPTLAGHPLLETAKMLMAITPNGI